VITFSDRKVLRDINEAPGAVAGEKCSCLSLRVHVRIYFNEAPIRVTGETANGPGPQLNRWAIVMQGHH